MSFTEMLDNMIKTLEEQESLLKSIDKLLEEQNKRQEEFLEGLRAINFMED